jgi:hypothetical protein
VWFKGHTLGVSGTSGKFSTIITRRMFSPGNGGVLESGARSCSRFRKAISPRIAFLIVSKNSGQ